MTKQFRGKNYDKPCYKVSKTAKILFTAALIGMNASLLTACNNSLSIPVSERTMNSFVEAVKQEDYETANNMLSFSNTPEENSSFSSFASTHLENCSYTITNDTDEQNIDVQIKSSTDTFDVTLISDGGDYKIQADDFIMNYQVQYLACYSSGHNNFAHNSSYIGNGITEYTVYTYKSENQTLNFDIMPGEEPSLVPNAKAEIAFDKDGNPSEVISVVDYLDSNNELAGYVTIKDNAIFIDTYCITEDYSRSIAQSFANALEDMVNMAFSGGDYDSFASWGRNKIVKDSEELKTTFNQFKQVSSYIPSGLSHEVELLNWNYDQYYHLGEKYNMTINVALHSYNSNGRETSVGENTSWRVTFIPDEEGFKVESMRDN